LPAELLLPFIWLLRFSLFGGYVMVALSFASFVVSCFGTPCAKFD
jgi:hypothetical protein